MKNLILTVLVLLATSGLQAQTPDPRLFENDWFLMELTVDGNSIEIPQTDEINSNVLELFFDEFIVGVSACNIYQGAIMEYTNTDIIVLGWALLFNDCFLQSTDDFESFYFGDFYSPPGAMGDTFGYVIDTEPNDALRLTISNSEGDIGVYGNPELGIEGVDSNAFTLYPNPSSEKIFLQLSEGVIINEIALYDLHGRLIKKETPNQTGLIQVETTDLDAGLYFIQVIDEEGKFSVKRFVKK